MSLTLTMTHNAHDRELAFIRHAHPTDGSKHFRAHKHLNVLYSSLFGLVDHQWSHIPAPVKDLLPSPIETLEIWRHKIEAFAWLKQIIYYQDVLPQLYTVGIQCLSEQLDNSYEPFAFSHFPNPHPIFATLPSLGVDLVLEEPFHWLPECDNYDIRALDLVAWQASLGEPILGMIQPQSF
jgi:hypothetical protein